MDIAVASATPVPWAIRVLVILSVVSLRIFRISSTESALDFVLALASSVEAWPRAFPSVLGYGFAKFSFLGSRFGFLALLESSAVIASFAKVFVHSTEDATLGENRKVLYSAYSFSALIPSDHLPKTIGLASAEFQNCVIESMNF